MQQCTSNTHPEYCVNLMRGHEDAVVIPCNGLLSCPCDRTRHKALRSAGGIRPIRPLRKLAQVELDVKLTEVHDLVQLTTYSARKRMDPVIRVVVLYLGNELGIKASPSHITCQLLLLLLVACGCIVFTFFGRADFDVRGIR